MLLGVELNLTIFFEVKPGACLQCSFLTGLLSRTHESICFEEDLPIMKTFMKFSPGEIPERKIP